MRLISKKIWIISFILLIPYVFIYVICFHRTDKEALMPGGLSNVNSLIEIDSDNKEEGSFNSIYVLTFPNTTILQNWLLGISNDTDTSDYSAYNHLTSKEERTMGSISHDSSVMYSLIYAYKEAAKIDSNVKLDYKLSGIKVYYRSVNSLFRVGDFIYKINDFDVNNDIENFVNAYNTKKTGDLFYIIRDGEEKCITYQNFTDDNWYTFYAYYDINYTTASPKIKVNSATSGGPSAGLLQTLSIFNRLTTNDYTMGLKIAGTGTIDVSGNVGAIGAIKQKVITASNNNADIFFCPKANSEEGKSAYDSLSSSKRKKMKFVIVEKFSDATNYLKELYETTN